jgi:hypothetical protein
MNQRRGNELLDYPTLATAQERRSRLELKVSTDMERIWLRDRREVVRELRVGSKWVVVERYPLGGDPVPNLFKSPDCRKCCSREMGELWRFCPHCGAPIRRRVPKRRTPTKN